jgi:hypothetical protein
MQTFLLGDPERQLPMLGSTDTLLAKGDQEKANGEKLRARMNYETAAKVEIYKQDKEGVEKCLRLAIEVTENEDRKALLNTMLANLDEVLRISKLYSGSVTHRNA